MYRNRSMCVCSGIDDNRCGIVDRFLDPVDDLAFMVRLAEVDLKSQVCADPAASRGDVVERLEAVDLRLPSTQQIQVGPVQHVYTIFQ